MRALWILAGLSACGGEHVAAPRAQALIYIDTDAPAPRLVNRLRITVLNESLQPRCSACVREVALDAQTQWPLSFGIAPAGRTFVRVTLFLSGRTKDGVPRPETAVDVIAEARPEGAQDLFLPFDCAGIAPRDGQSCGAAIAPLAAHIPASSRVGSYHAEVRTDCGAPPQDPNEVCIRGGVFWFGDYRLQGFGRNIDAVPERAVALKPFYLDTYEYSVARYRAALKKGFSPTPAPLQNCFDPAEPGKEVFCSRCNLAPGAEADGHALNCASHSLALRLCAFEGKRLPTEAEWEWAGGSREEERLYAWGNHDAAVCKSAEEALTGACMPFDQWDVLMGNRWADPVLQAHPYDVTADGVFGMSYGVAEWVSDAFQHLDQPCWLPGSYDVSPQCTSSVTKPLRRSMRSTHRWMVGSGSFAIANRGSVEPNALPHVGFRCARTVE